MTERLGYSKEQRQIRAMEIEQVSRVYQCDQIFSFDFASTTLDNTIPRRDLIGAIANVVDSSKPEIVYLPNCTDIHSDHRIICESALAVLKTFRAPSVKRLLSYETLSETEFAPPFQSDVFIPNSFSDITGYLEKKIEMMRIYKGELKPHPFPRSEENIKALATLRGATAGVKHAEGFMVLKEIW